MSKSVLQDQKLLNRDEIDFCDKLFSRSGQLKNPNSKVTQSKNPVNISKNPIHNAQNPVEKSKNSVNKTKNSVEKFKNSLSNTQSPDDKSKNQVKKSKNLTNNTQNFGDKSKNPVNKEKKFVEKYKNSPTNTQNPDDKSKNPVKKSINPIDISKIPGIPANENPMKKKERLKCDFCEKIFTKAMHLTAHITYKHKNVNGPLTPQMMSGSTHGPLNTAPNFLAHGPKTPYPITHQTIAYDASSQYQSGQFYNNTNVGAGFYNQSTAFENWRQIQQWQAYYHNSVKSNNDSVIYLNASQSSVSPLPYHNY